MIILQTCLISKSEAETLNQSIFYYKNINQEHKCKLRQMKNSSYSKKQVIFNTYLAVKYCINNRIRGSFAECGVAEGSQAGAMVLGLEGRTRQIHLFDSFAGFPLCGQKDTHQPGIEIIKHDKGLPEKQRLLSSNDYYPELRAFAKSSIKRVKNNMIEWELSSEDLIFHEGWFQYTLPKISKSIKRIALLRLDGYLYESIKICLRYLYPKLSQGGIILLNRYESQGCRNALYDYFKEENINPTLYQASECDLIYFFKP